MKAGDFKLKDKYTFAELCDLVHFLRSPDGCPWDKVQTHASLRKGMLEEAYEAVQAISAHDMENLREELGDVLLQVIFHADLAAEENAFTFDDIVSSLCYKLIARHSHVFGKDQAKDPEAVKQLWEQNKLKEKGVKNSSNIILQQDSAVQKMKKVSPAAGSLYRADEMQKIAAKQGFDWPDPQGAKDKILEELAEVEAALPAEKEEELGDLLFAVINYVRLQGVDANLALDRANEKFLRRYTRMVAKAGEAGMVFQNLSLAEMDEFWNAVKKDEKNEIR